MIKYFRNIRQKLLTEGKTANYLKYAIGEIALVMIGILLALQVNNWNEQQKLLKQEKEILLTLHEELEQIVNYLKSNSEHNRGVIKRTVSFLDSSKPQTVPPDSISKLTSLFYFHPIEIDHPILNNILDSSTDKLIEHKILIKDLRKLKRKLNSVKLNLSYLDKYWDESVTNYFISSGLGNSMGHDYKYDKVFILDQKYITLLIMQKGLLASFTASVESSQILASELHSKITKISLHD